MSTARAPVDYENNSVEWSVWKKTVSRAVFRVEGFDERSYQRSSSAGGQSDTAIERSDNVSLESQNLCTVLGLSQRNFADLHILEMLQKGRIFIWIS